MPEVTSHPPGAFCWMELGTTDQEAAKTFYGKLFDWTARDLPIGPSELYTTFQLRGKDAAAAFTLDPKRFPGIPPHWMLYVAASDVNATARRATELGGGVKVGPFDVMELGRMAVLTDPTGGMIAVWQAKTQIGIGVHNEPGAFCWGQLNTTDTAKAEAFYKALFGWEAKTGTGGGMTYTEWLLGGTPIGGMMEVPPGAPGPTHWLAYFAVADCDAAAARVASLGGRTHVPPTNIEGMGRFAVFGDPQGAPFAVYKE